MAEQQIQSIISHIVYDDFKKLYRIGDMIH